MFKFTNRSINKFYLLKVLLILEFFFFAIFIALFEISIATPFDFFNSFNKEIIIQPDPVPTSKIKGFYFYNISPKLQLKFLFQV